MARVYRRLAAALAWGAAVFILTSCTAPEPRPEGVGIGYSFSVTPLYPKSFEITASGSRLRSGNDLKEAWEKKAKMLANGRRYKITAPPIVRNDETDDPYGGPLLSRSVTGTIMLLE